MIRQFILILGLITVFSACIQEGDLGLDNPSTVFPPEDYRELYHGTYEATKSSYSFEDENFRTAIDDIVIAIPADTDSIITVDGIEMKLNEDGTTGNVSMGNFTYNDLSFQDSTFYLLSTYAPINGIGIPCYIIGKKKGN